MSSSLRIVNDQSSYDISSIAPNRIAEALLTSTSTPPASSAASSTQRRAPVLGGEVDGGDRVHPAAGRPDQLDGLLRGALVQVAADDVRALPGAHERGRPADAAAGPRDEDRLARQPAHGSSAPRRSARWPPSARHRRSCCRGRGSSAGSGR